MSANLEGRYFSVHKKLCSSIISSGYETLKKLSHYITSSSEITTKSPNATIDEQGINAFPSLVLSNSSFAECGVGFFRIMWINSPDFVSKTKSPTSPNRFPDLLTTTLPINCFENHFSSVSAITITKLDLLYYINISVFDDIPE